MVCKHQFLIVLCDVKYFLNFKDIILQRYSADIFAFHCIFVQCSGINLSTVGDIIMYVGKSINKKSLFCVFFFILKTSLNVTPLLHHTYGIPHCTQDNPPLH